LSRHPSSSLCCLVPILRTRPTLVHFRRQRHHTASVERLVGLCDSYFTPNTLSAATRQTDLFREEVQDCSPLAGASRPAHYRTALYPGLASNPAAESFALPGATAIFRFPRACCPMLEPANAESLYSASTLSLQPTLSSPSRHLLPCTESLNLGTGKIHSISPIANAGSVA
jgi:hypothetical protein